jgi:hypothetical protein
MLGALINDLAGSVYEWNPVKRKDFQPLLAAEAFFTDDRVPEAITCALEAGDFEDALRNAISLSPSPGRPGAACPGRCAPPSKPCTGAPVSRCPADWRQACRPHDPCQRPLPSRSGDTVTTTPRPHRKGP